MISRRTALKEVQSCWSRNAREREVRSKRKVGKGAAWGAVVTFKAKEWHN
jgi:hypothetical protein